MSWNALPSDPWTITIVGGVAVLFLGWLGKSLFRLASDDNKAVAVTQNASPVMTQNFQPTIVVEPPVTERVRTPMSDQSGAQALEKLRTETEFRNVQQLWIRFTALRDAFWALPKLGVVIGQADGASRRKASADFIDRYNEAAKFLNEEVCIPKSIVCDARALLRIAAREATQAALVPDPFDPMSFGMTYGDLLDQRSNNLRSFSDGTDALKDSIRLFLEGKGKS